jgi:uncharacterized protein
MNPITSFIKRQPQVVFWAIAYIVSFGGYALSLMYPSDFWPFAIWGVALGGALVTGIADGRAGLKAFLSRIVRWRVGIQWYAIALLTPFAVGAAAFGLTLLTGTATFAEIQFPVGSQILMIYLLSLLTLGLGEEPGFRGFALPRFLVGRSAFAASLILGVLHALWHLPLVLGGESHVLTLLHPLCGAILFTWVFNHTNGSVLLAILLHAAADTSAGLFGSLFAGSNETLFVIWQAAAFLAMAVLLRAFAGRELGRKAGAANTLVAEQPGLAG